MPSHAVAVYVREAAGATSETPDYSVMERSDKCMVPHCRFLQPALKHIFLFAFFPGEHTDVVACVGSADSLTDLILSGGLDRRGKGNQTDPFAASHLVVCDV